MFGVITLLKYAFRTAQTGTFRVNSARLCQYSGHFTPPSCNWKKWSSVGAWICTVLFSAAGGGLVKILDRLGSPRIITVAVGIVSALPCCCVAWCPMPSERSNGRLAPRYPQRAAALHPGGVVNCIGLGRFGGNAAGLSRLAVPVVACLTTFTPSPCPTPRFCRGAVLPVVVLPVLPVVHVGLVVLLVVTLVVAWLPSPGEHEARRPAGHRPPGRCPAGRLLVVALLLVTLLPAVVLLAEKRTTLRGGSVWRPLAFLT